MKAVSKNSRKPFYFSIDLEDFCHDLKRSLGDDDPPSNIKALEESYKTIQRFSLDYFNGKKLTFFTTGILAKKHPEFLKRIFDDGHEIACHYNFHDDIFLSNRKEFARELDKAIESIEDAIGQKPIGFRAPNFAINESDRWAYEEISLRFEYDSSFQTSSIKNNIKYFSDLSLKEFYIFVMPIFKGKMNFRAGGTYFRLFSSNTTLRSFNEGLANGHTPLLYLHPYEFTSSFLVSWKELNFLPIKDRLITWLRQLQWCWLGHSSVEKKIKDITVYFEHQGPMKELLTSKK